MHKFILTTILYLFVQHVIAQVTISLYPLQVLQVRPSDVFHADVSNLGNETHRMYFIGTIVNMQNGQKIVSGRTKVIELSPGTKQLTESILSPVYTFGSSAVEQTGSLPYGNYQVCLKGYGVADNEEMASACEEVEVTPLSPPLLLSPENQSVIEEDYPLLVWLPPMPVSKDRIAYDLKLVELVPNQTPYDAMQRNYALLDKKSIRGTTLQYPSNAMKLESHKTYAWKVIAKTLDGQPIGETEIWTFKKAAPDSTPVKETRRSMNYVEMKRRVDADFIIASKELKVVYVDIYPHKKMTFTVQDMNHNVLTELKDEVAQAGENKYVISLEETGKLKNGLFYILEAADEQKGKQYLLFKYSK